MADANPLVLLLTMPHLDGAGAFAKLRRIRPDVRVTLKMSGYSEHPSATQFAGKDWQDSFKNRGWTSRYEDLVGQDDVLSK